jgi:hypothetical protein
MLRARDGGIKDSPIPRPGKRGQDGRFLGGRNTDRVKPPGRNGDAARNGTPSFGTGIERKDPCRQWPISRDLAGPS